MKVLFVGDIVGRLGRKVLKTKLKSLKKELNIDIVIANVENASGGFGCSLSSYDELSNAGVDYMTSGNHIYDQKDLVKQFNNLDRIVRPLNYPEENPGRGYLIAKTAVCDLVIINLLGRVFLQPCECPFHTSRKLITELKYKGYKNIIVDIHAEATSEKIALFKYLDGAVSAVVGTHTHVQTADEKVSQSGTAYISDVGMTGYNDGVLGFEKEPIIGKFLTQMPSKFYAPKAGNSSINAVLIELDEKTGIALSISRVSS